MRARTACAVVLAVAALFVGPSLKHGLAPRVAHAGPKIGAGAPSTVVARPIGINVTVEREVITHDPPAPEAPRAKPARPRAGTTSQLPPLPPPASETESRSALHASVRLDDPFAVTAFERACDRGSAYACAALGNLYATGAGIPRDEARGASLLKKGCGMGDTWACGRLRELSTRVWSAVDPE